MDMSTPVHPVAPPLTNCKNFGRSVFTNGGNLFTNPIVLRTVSVRFLQITSNYNMQAVFWVPLAATTIQTVMGRGWGSDNPAKSRNERRNLS